MSRILFAVPLVFLGCASPDADPGATGTTADAADGSDDIPADGAQSPGTPVTGPWSGFNLPPTQGSSNAGAFLPGVYTWDYSVAQVQAASATFNAMRLPINVASANDPAALAKLKSYVDAYPGQRALICMFDTTTDPATSHGDGLASVAEMGTAWQKIHAVFGSYPNVHYEILNEPFGYPKNNPARYVNEMKAIISAGGLPASKCILDGMGYADDIAIVANAGWTGDLAFHFYPNWSSDHTQSAYSNLVQARIGSLGSRTWITEFGAALNRNNNCYETYDDGTKPEAADINALRGLDDALRALRAKGHRIKGSFLWHGWNNADSYDYWLAGNANGACKVRLIQAHQ